MGSIIRTRSGEGPTKGAGWVTGVQRWDASYGILVKASWRKVPDGFQPPYRFFPLAGKARLDKDRCRRVAQAASAATGDFASPHGDQDRGMRDAWRRRLPLDCGLQGSVHMNAIIQWQPGSAGLSQRRAGAGQFGTAPSQMRRLRLRGMVPVLAARSCRDRSARPAAGTVGRT